MHIRALAPNTFTKPNNPYIVERERFFVNKSIINKRLMEKPNNEFTHQLCNKWESEAMAMEEFGCRVSITNLKGKHTQPRTG